ncbi:MAG: hypothetical protein LBO66_04855 [Deltaproteobacteria bacterium]|jgi:hypothetical protein|nr:hypothetical protein [Deltaproteobacteria bacterium]
MAAIVHEFEPLIGGYDPKSGSQPLSVDQLIRLFLAPLGRVPKDSEETTGRRLVMARVLSQGTEDSLFLLIEFYAVLARADIASPALVTKYWKELINMPRAKNPLMKELLGSFVGALAEKNEAQAKEISSQAKEIASQAKEIASKDLELANLKTIYSVLALFAFNKSPEEISVKLGLELAEVNRILETAAGAI